MRPRRRFFPFVGTLLRQTRQDRNYAGYLVTRALAGFGYMAFGFLTIFATERFSLPNSAAATYTMVLFAGQGVTSIFMGAVGERKGYRFLSLLASSSWIASLLFALFASSPVLFALALFTAGIALATDGIASFNFIFESCQELDKSGYIGLANLLVAPMFMSAPLIGGFLIDNFSYTAMFLTSLAAYSATFGILLFVVKDPRFLYAVSAR